MTGAEIVADPFSPMAQKSPTTAINGASLGKQLGDDEGAETEAKKRAEKQAILDRRAARRKSMANRRVSFAPEATLHTWSVMELAEDSTTSSAANSTRRQSAMTIAPSSAKNIQSPRSTDGEVDIPSTPPEQIEEPAMTQSPVHQRDLHQKKRRRESSSADSAVDDVYSSSPSGDITTDSSPLRVAESIDSDDSDTDGDTAMSMDEGTSHTVASQHSVSSTQSSLDERLRRAANHAGTRGIDFDEHGDDLSMEIADDTVTNALQPWMQDKVQYPNISVIQDQENVNPFSPAFKAQAVQNLADQKADGETQDVTMDMTRAAGGILQQAASPGKNKRKSISRRRSSIVGRRSSDGESSFGDESMDFTTAAGGILRRQAELSDNDAGNESEAMSDEDMTMEMTNVVGGVLAEGHRGARQPPVPDDNATMEMTAAVGGILAPTEEHTEPQTDIVEDATMTMDMTRAVGAILSSESYSMNRATAKHLMQEEADLGQLNEVEPAEQNLGNNHIPFQSPQQHITSIASETGSPSFALKPRLSGRSRVNAYQSTTPNFTPNRSTPIKTPTSNLQFTPTKQLTPLPTKAETPNKTPIAVNVTHRGASPKKLFKAELKARASPRSSTKDATITKSLFSKDETTGLQTPSVVLHAPKPHQHLRRRSSGIGLDKEGIGSPRVSELLSRRQSIGDAAQEFKIKGREQGRLRFEDPVQIENEIDAEREEQHRRESGRFIMEQEANEQQDDNATQQLKEMIESMTPRKDKYSKLKGRKSLAVGAAKGLLGKRPAELDLEDQEDGDGTPKRLRTVSRDSSPIKKVHLPRPPSKEETTGRLSRVYQMRLDGAVSGGVLTPVMAVSPEKELRASSPQATGRFRNVNPANQDAGPTSFEDKLDNVVGAIDVATADMGRDSIEEDREKISLQDFLNMTNIHFIELNTTKRRHTMAQSLSARPSQDGHEQSPSVESCFAAAATTLPLLELYQHATRELKSYISTGRKIIRSIEAETLAEQPPLFREYVDARPDIKLVMDNQFRNGKINARLQSKEGWYTWRTQLVDGLKGGLDGIKQGMAEDDNRLSEQQEVLAEVIPGLNERQAELQYELAALEQSLAEMDSVDHETLRVSRRQLQSADEDLLQKSTMLDTLRQQMNDKEEALAAAAELKNEMQDQIAEADRVREEHKGWPVEDVMALRSKVHTLQKQTGWSLSAAEEDPDGPSDFGVALTMSYKSELRLFFYPAAYQTGDADAGHRRTGRKSKSVSGPSAPISLTFSQITEDEAMPASELSTEKRFFLQLIRSQLQAFSMMPKGAVTPRTLLDTVSRGWNMANQISSEVRLLNMIGITSTTILGDEKLGTKVMLMLTGKGRVDIEFNLSVVILNDGEISATTGISIKAIYGAARDLLTDSKTRKVQQALTKEVESKELGSGAWVRAVHGFQQWYSGQTLPKPEAEAGPQLQPVREEEKPTQPTPAPKRSPLAPKKTPALQKKTLPVPTQRLEKIFKSAAVEQPQAFALQKEKDKENLAPLPVKALQPPVERIDLDLGRPAMTPQMQEELMKHATPVKRVGALRRSPL